MILISGYHPLCKRARGGYQPHDKRVGHWTDELQHHEKVDILLTQEDEGGLSKTTCKKIVFMHQKNEKQKFE